MKLIAAILLLCFVALVCWWVGGFWFAENISKGGSAGRPEDVVAVFDLSGARAAVKLDDERSRKDFYDEVFLVSSLQGLANRETPRLYMRYDAKLDDFWWQRLTEPGTWLAKASTVRARS